MNPLGVEILAQPLERVAADVLLLGLSERDRPLRGGAGRADWRLCGLISRLVEQDRICGRWGEAALIGTGGVLESPRLLLVGCGDAALLDRSSCRRFAEDALRRAAALPAGRVAVGLPLATGAGVISLDASALAVVEAALEALDPQAGARLLLVVPTGTEFGLEEVVRRFGQGRLGVSLEVVVPAAANGAEPGAAAAAERARRASPSQA